MKKIFILVLVLISSEINAQFPMDFQTSISSLAVAKLNDSKTKYYDYSQWNNFPDQFSLFNLDGTIYQTISLPPKPDPSGIYAELDYITESLFDNDPSTIEYIVVYGYDSIPSSSYYTRVKVIREDGAVIFDELYAATFYIFSTEEGAKLRLTYYYANGQFFATKVFSLPGILPTSFQEQSNLENNSLNIYPNPNNGSFFIQFRSENGKENIIDLYTTNGNLLNTYKSNTNLLYINDMRLTEGLYLLNNRVGNRNSTTRMIMKK